MAGTIREAYIANPLATLNPTDLIPIGEDPGGSPADGAIPFSVLMAQIGDGWLQINATGTSGTLDTPSFEISFDADMTGIIGLGDRIRISQATTKYFIITKVGAFGGGATIITCYGGTDYALVASGTTAITLPYVSHAKSPFGFPVDPTKWTVSIENTTAYTKTSPVSGTWYSAMDAGSLPSIDVPIGIWDTYYELTMSVTSGAAKTAINIFTTLSTGIGSESDALWTAMSNLEGASATLVIAVSVAKRSLVILTTKDTLYLNIKTNKANVVTIKCLGSTVTTKIKAICAYL